MFLVAWGVVHDARGGYQKKVFLANIYERNWPKKVSGDTEHEGETLSTRERH